jgi:hypothetical protein
LKKIFIISLKQILFAFSITAMAGRKPKKTEYGEKLVGQVVELVKS